MANSSASVTWSEVAKAYNTLLDFPEVSWEFVKKWKEKRAQDFAVYEGKLHYKVKNGRNRIVITSKMDERVFQVSLCLVFPDPVTNMYVELEYFL